MLQLQRNVPPPGKRRLRPGDGRKKYPFEKMTKVGDFFFVPHKKRESIRTYFSTAGAAYGIKLRSEQIFAKRIHYEGGRVAWAPCDEHERGAVSGVGVWRIE
jgi:hypothetical protein